MTQQWQRFKVCLLYTSDAADDGYSVDLGGRRIIKKIFFKQKTAYEISEGLVGSEMCIRDSAKIGILPEGMYRNRTFAEAGVDVGEIPLWQQDLMLSLIHI